MSIGTYVQVFEHGAWTNGIVRNVSGDARIAYVELEGSADLWRFSPDELREKVAS